MFSKKINAYPQEWLKVKKTDSSKCWQAYGALGTHTLPMETRKGTAVWKMA